MDAEDEVRRIVKQLDELIVEDDKIEVSIPAIRLRALYQFMLSTVAHDRVVNARLAAIAAKIAAVRRAR